LLRSGLANYLDRRALFVRAFPDIHFQILELSAMGERVVTSFHWTGTHTGPYHAEIDGEFRDISPTGARVFVYGIASDTIRGTKIVDHAAYYDAAAIVRQLLPKGSKGEGATPSPAKRPSTDSDFAEARGIPTSDQADETERAAREQMQRFFADKVPQLLATASDVGIAICGGGGEGEAAGEGGALPIAVGCVSCARALGLQSAEECLGVSLVSHLGASAAADVQPDVAECLAALAGAAKAARPAQHLIATRRASGSTALLLASTAPFEVDGMRLTAVLLVDVTADPSSPHAISEAAAAVSHPYCMRGALLNGLSRSGSASAFCARLLTAAVQCWRDVGFSLADNATPNKAMVWVSDGFVAMTGYRRSQIVGRSCKRLQCEATDPHSILRLGEAIRAGRGERVTLWNATASGGGFWNCVSVHPSRNGRYFVAAQVRVGAALNRRMAELLRSIDRSRAASASCLGQERFDAWF